MNIPVDTVREFLLARSKLICSLEISNTFRSIPAEIDGMITIPASLDEYLAIYETMNEEEKNQDFFKYLIHLGLRSAVWRGRVIVYIVPSGPVPLLSDLVDLLPEREKKI